MTRLAAFSLSLLSMAPAFAASDMQGMDHSRMADMQGMDHSQMTGMQSMDDGMMQPAAPTESRTPIPALTDADRAAVFTSHAGHQVHDSAINTYFLADKLEWQDADDASTLAWDLSGWIGGDIDRLWLRSEGERSNGKTEDAEIQALWGHAISPWWDVVSGVRQDFKPGAPQTWAAFGLQGMALYNFEAEATAFLGENGQSALRLEGDYDILLTNRLILQPTAELNVYGKNDPQRGIGSGLANTEAGLRLRYEIRREFAPYIGVIWNRTYGHTADYAREEGEDRSEARLVLGVRLWF
ncbi:copper resistance protein B [Pseudomonas fluorescens]|uniref:copper resistance protein B n=1 Tax=Pseudomonas fluorescens TaxID=294 RepID=UPI0013980598|nr:copper resistance protein B [Pseudomonas fluorescens]QIA04406.1 copper resistance protein B [Pseudomonas fluorescens]